MNDGAILLIEDNEQNRYLVTFLLERSGYRVVSVEDGRRGIEMARTCAPSLILLDIQLPGLSGFEVLERLRAAPATRRIPVIAVSANAMPADVDAGRAAGFFDYLTKVALRYRPLQPLLPLVEPLSGRAVQSGRLEAGAARTARSHGTDERVMAETVDSPAASAPRAGGRPAEN